MTSTDNDERLKVLLATLEEMAGGDLGRVLPISPAHDLLDALACAVNILVSELRYASSTKHVFLRNVSHELRTPLSAIVSLSELLASGSVSIVQAQTLARRIERNAHALLRLVGDLLDLSQLDAGFLAPEPEEVLVFELASDVMRSFEPQAVGKGIHLAITAEAGAPAFVFTDPRRLRQILMNLVGNAVKFTERGEIRVVVGACEEGLTIDIIDTGIGIASDEQPRLFSAFAQGGRDVMRRYGGTGLGLELSRRLAQVLGGDVRLVDSAPGVGSTFRLTILPAVPAASIETDQPSTGPPKDAPVQVGGLLGMRVLLAEDNADAQHALAALLGLAGCSVVVAQDGLAAYEQALGGAFDVVLMDVQMPKMDGLEATRRLRRAGYSGPVFALTADAMPEHRAHCLQAGCDDHLPKPIEYKRLVERLRALWPA